MKVKIRELNLPVPTRVIYGQKLIDEMVTFLPATVRKVTIVIGKGSVRRSGLLDRILTPLQKHGLETTVFEGVEENPSWATCLRGRDFLLRQGAELIIALGGGSVLDTAKAMALAVTNTGSLAGMIERRDYLREPLPTMAIPTTAGTGSEVTQYCIITDENTHDKLNLHTPHSFPKTAILDPICTISMPEALAIGTGMDALSHAVEGFLSRRACSESDRVALESIGMIGKFLEAGIREPENLELRENMLLAAAKAGAVISRTGTILLHALGYRLTLDHGVHHGLANAVLFYPFLLVTQRYQPQKVQGILDAFLGTHSTLEDLKGYLMRLGIKPDIGRFGVKSEEFEAIARYVLAKKNLPDTPFPVTSRDIFEILALAMN
ncbi:MAG: iron-containing alcohol dehydrogenase [Thermodesulfobacteriota bacterium]|nr:iron-containing alcohol dehydrogenase [Thermodesulfobacteriota bacterium]